MADVFLSYSQTDRDRVSGIIRTLEDAGWSVWWDAHGRAGTDLDEMVQQELDAASCVIVVWSTASVRSDWVLNEADVGRKRRILVPVAIDAVEPPLRFRSINTVSLSKLSEDTHADALKRVMEGIKFHVCSQTEDPASLQMRGYEIALDRIDKGEDLGAGKYFSIHNNGDPIWLLTSEFGWRMALDKTYSIHLGFQNVFFLSE